MIPRKGAPTVTARWVAKVGSVKEHSGITGISRLFEDMMFKGNQTIGTRNIEEDLKLNFEQDRVKEELRKEEQDLARRFRRHSRCTPANEARPGPSRGRVTRMLVPMGSEVGPH
jgi:hypothetical protein